MYNRRSPVYNWYLDDLEPGAPFETRAKTLSEAEILDFAFRYDPQPFHIDAEGAKEGPFGGLIASGLGVAGGVGIAAGVYGGAAQCGGRDGGG